MSTRKRLSPEESRIAALEAARGLLIEAGPQAVTLKAVAARIGRTHANLLHHFGSASGLQKALAGHLAATICATIREAVIASRSGIGCPRDVVDLDEYGSDAQRGNTLALVLVALGDALMGGPLAQALDLPRDAAREKAEAMLVDGLQAIPVTPKA